MIRLMTHQFDELYLIDEMEINKDNLRLFILFRFLSFSETIEKVEDKANFTTRIYQFDLHNMRLLYNI